MRTEAGLVDGSCMIAGCSLPIRCKALCAKHYSRALYRSRNPEVKVVYNACPTACGCETKEVDHWCRAFRLWMQELLAQSVTAEPPPVDPLALPVSGPCWTWTGSSRGRTESTRYGLVGVAGRLVRTHRIAVACSGRILGDKQVDHRCRNTLCINPDHLDVVTNEENKRRTRKEFCANGHEWTDDNTYIRPDTGRRQCQACRAAARARRWT